MCSQILRISPFASSTNLILHTTPISSTARFFFKSPHISAISNAQFRALSRTTFQGKNCTNRFGELSPIRHRGIRGGVVVAMAAAPGSVEKSEEEWQAILSPEQFRILRQKGTEYPGTGEYNKFYCDGVYKCAGCETPLYKSTTKFDSGCGWPAFYEGLPGAINRTADPDGSRVEITCAACGGHLGHDFKGEGFRTPTDERHCVNSVSLKFTPANSNASQ